jgi:hypothetical protein
MSCLPDSIVDPAETNPGRALYVEHFAFQWCRLQGTPIPRLYPHRLALSTIGIVRTVRPVLAEPGALGF